MEVIGYHKERRHWKEYEIKVSNNQAEMIVKKLARHFKLQIYHVYFHGRQDSGTAYNFGHRIRLSQNPSIGTICHEVNHFLCWKKFGTRDSNGKKSVRHGTKKWCRQMQVILNYAKKKNFWNEEFERKITPKEPKPEPTKQELRLKKIESLESGIKRHKSKIKRCTTLIKKNNRRISALKRFI